MSNTSNSKYIIGKIPGYNNSILPSNDPDKKLYYNRLINNLNTIELTPVSYKLNFDSELGAWIIDTLQTVATTMVDGQENTSTNALNTKYNEAATNIANFINTASQQSITDTLTKLTNSVFGGLSVNTYDANKIWHEMLYWNTGATKEILGGTRDSKGAILKAIDSSISSGFTILGVNDSTFNEVISNEYGTNSFQEIASQMGEKIKNNTLGSLAAAGSSLYRSYDTSAGLNLLSTTGNLGLLGALADVVQGIKISLPQVWKGGDYNSSLNIIIKLISPSGDQKSVQQYIKTPLEILLRAASPVTYNGISYGYPMIWKVKAHGIMTLKLAAITAMTITRGGNDTVYNKYDEPLNVDVRLMITPINPGFAQGPLGDYTMTDPTDIMNSLSSGVDSDNANNNNNIEIFL
jgi:hypothetical protein